MAFQTDFQSQLKDPKQKRMLITAGVVFIAVGLVIYRMVFTTSTESPVASHNPAPGVRAQSSSAKSQPVIVRESDIKRIKLDTEILKTPLFQELTIYSSNVPVKVLEQGNPYAFQKAPVVTPPPTPSPAPTGNR